MLRSWLWADSGCSARPGPGRFHQEGIAQTFELRSQTHRVPGAFGGELVRSDAAPLQAQLEEGGGPEMCGTAPQRMSSIPESRGVALERRGFELLDQLLSIGDELTDQSTKKVVAVIQLTQPVQVRDVEDRARFGIGIGRVHGIRRRPRAHGCLCIGDPIDHSEKLLHVHGLGEIGGDPGLLTLTPGFFGGIRSQRDERRRLPTTGREAMQLDRIQAVHDRHVDVHQNDVELAELERL